MVLLWCVYFLSTAHARAELWDRVAQSFQAGNYRDALVLLEEADDTDPDNIQIHRIRGICLMKLGRLRDAESVLRRAIELRHDNAASHYYLAQVLALQGNLAEAEKHLWMVTELAPASTYAARAHTVLPGLDRLRDTLLVQDAPKRWSLYLRVAGEHDDNVPARSRHESADDTDSYRLTASLHVSYRFPDQRLDPPWPTLEVGYTHYRSFHDDSTFSDFDVRSDSARLRLSRHGTVFGKWVELGVSGSYSETKLGGDKFNTDIGGSANLTLQPWTSFLAVFGYSAHRKDFEFETEFPEFFSRDGLEQEATLNTYAYLFRNRLILGLGYGYLWNDVDGSQFELKRHRVTGSATLSLPKKFRLFASVSYANEDYDKFVPEPKRADDVITYYASLSRPLWRDQFRAEANVTHSTTDSSQEFAEYHRTVYGLAVSWSP